MAGSSQLAHSHLSEEGSSKVPPESVLLSGMDALVNYTLEEKCKYDQARYGHAKGDGNASEVKACKLSNIALRRE